MIVNTVLFIYFRSAAFDGWLHVSVAVQATNRRNVEINQSISARLELSSGPDQLRRASHARSVLFF